MSEWMKGSTTKYLDALPCISFEQTLGRHVVTAITDKGFKKSSQTQQEAELR